MADWNETLYNFRKSEAEARGKTILPYDKDLLVNVTNRMLKSNPDSMSEMDKTSLVGTWLEENGYSADGVGYFTDDANGISGDKMLKLWQSQIDPKRHEDVLSDYEKWKGKDAEQKAEDAPIFTKENIVAQLEVMAGSGLEDYFVGSDYTDFAKKRASVEAEGGRLLGKDFMAMRAMYESVVTSDNGRAFAKSVAETGVWDDNAYRSLPPEEQKVMSGYIQAIKPRAQDGVVSESAIAFANGIKDIVAGGIDYVGKKGVQGYYSAKDLAGDRTAKDMLAALDEVQRDQKAEADALATKFDERGFGGKMSVGIAGSLPLMASFFIPVPGTTVAATGGKFGKVATSFQKLVRHMPVGLATMSMAKSHEDMMVERGVDRDVAGLIAPPTAVVNMYVEKMALDKIIGISKGKLFKISNDYLATAVLSRGEGFLRSFAAGATTETIEEVLQGLNEEIATQLGLGKLDAQRLTEEALTTFIETLPTTVGFGAFAGVGGAVSSNLNISDTERAFTRDTVFRERVSSLNYEPDLTEDQKAEQYNTIFTEWEAAETPVDKEAVLDKYNVRNKEDATTTFEQESTSRTEFVEGRKLQLEDARAKRIAFVNEELPQLQEEAKAFATEAGIDAVNFVEAITDAVSGREVGAIKGNIIEVLKTFADPKQIVRHEVFHKFLEDLNVLEDAERKLLSSAEGKIVEALSEAGLNTQIYEAMEGDKRSKEILADAGAILNEQELSVWQKVMDVYERAKNFVRGEGFKSFRSILKDVESRGMAQAKEALPQADSEAPRFAERVEDAERTFQQATESLAVRMVKGEKVDEKRASELMPEGSPFTAKSVVNEAAAIAGELGLEGEALKEASDAAIRLGVERVSDKRYLERLTKRVQRGGVRAGIKAAEQERQAKKRVAQAKKRAEKSERNAAEANPSVQIRDEIAVQGADVGSIIDSIVTTVKDALGEGVSDNLFNATLQKTIYTVLTRANNTLSSARTRASVAKKLEAIRTTDGMSADSIINQAKKIALQINESTVKQDRKSLLTRISTTLKKNISREGARKEEGKRKVGPKLNSWLKLVKQATGMDSAAKQSALAGLSKGINEPVADDSKAGQQFRDDMFEAMPELKQFDDLSNADLAHIALEIVSTFGNINSLGISDLQDAIESLNASIDVGKIQRLQAIREKRAENKRKAEEVANGIVSDKTKKLGEKASALTSMVSSIMGLRSMFKLIASTGTGDTNTVAKERLAKILREYNRADQAYRLEEFESHAEFLSNLAEIYGVEVPGLRTLKPGIVDAFSVLTSLKKKQDKYKKYSNDGKTPLSKLDLLFKYGSAVQDHGAKAKQQMEERGISIDAMFAELSEQDRQLLNLYREYYKEQLPFINKVMKRIAGVKIDMSDPLYLPMARVSDAGSGIRETHNAMSLFPQYFVDRVDSERMFTEDYDIHDMWLMRMAETAKFKHFADVNIKIRDVLLHDKTLEAIGASWGGKVADAWRDKLSLQMIGYVSNDTTAAKGFQRNLNAVRKMWVGSKFFMNMRIGLKQTTSVPAFAFEIGLKNTGLYLKDSLSTNGIFTKGSEAQQAVKEILSHPLAKERGKLGNSEALRAFLTNTSPSKFRRMLQLGRLPNTVGDMIPTILVGQGIYRSYWHELHEKGMSEANAKEEAMSRLFEIVESTQQSGRSKDLSDLQLTDSVFQKMLFTFKSTVRQYLEKEVVDFIALTRAEEGMKGQALKDFGRTMAINHIILPSMYNGMNILLNAMLGDEPDEDDVSILLMSMLLGPSSALPMYGVMIAGLTDSLMTGKFRGYGDTITPFASAIGDVRAVAATFNGLAPWTDRTVGEGVDKLLESTFAPYREIKKAVEEEK